MNNSDFDKFFADYKDYVYAFTLKKVKFDESLAEEIVQITFLKAYKFLQKENINFKTVKTWLCVIASNAIVDHFRKLKNANCISYDQVYEDKETCKELSSDFNMDNIANSIVTNQILKDAFNILETKSKSIFNTFMVYLETDDYEKTSQLENICIGTTKSRIHRARQILKENLSEDSIACLRN